MKKQETKHFMSKKDGSIGIYVRSQIGDNDEVRHVLLVNNKEIEMANSTFKRWWKECEVVQVADEIAKKTQSNYAKYHKAYKRNSAPLWDSAVGKDGELYLRNSDKENIMQIYKTASCIVVSQIKLKSKRYFFDINKVIKHVLYNQDIRTTKVLTESISKWFN